MPRTEWPDLRPSLFRRVRAVLFWGACAFMVVAVALSVAGFVFESQGRRRDAARFEPPGQLVDIGGRALHARVLGEGDLTVVFEAGLGGSSFDWWAIAPEVAEFARVVAYDRAGMGWSEPAAPPRDTYAMVADLEALLRTLNIEPPYVFVGHSMGGYIVRVYHSRHPNDVAGMVLVDASHEEQWDKIPARFQYLLRGSEYITRGVGALAHVGAPRFVANAFPGSFPGELEILPTEIRRNLRSRLVRPAYARSVADESASIIAGAAQVRETRTDLGDMPLVVLTSSESADSETGPIATWETLQQDQASLSTEGVQRTVPDTSHYVHLDAPDAVVEAVREVVNAAQLSAAFRVTPAHEAAGDEADVWKPRPNTP